MCNFSYKLDAIYKIRQNTKLNYREIKKYVKKRELMFGMFFFTFSVVVLVSSGWYKQSIDHHFATKSE